MGEIVYLRQPPKGCEWLLVHACWKNGGVIRNTAIVFNYEKGLTAFEAWRLAKLQGNPPYYEVSCEMLMPYPYNDIPQKKAVLNGQSDE